MGWGGMGIFDKVVGGRMQFSSPAAREVLC